MHALPRYFGQLSAPVRGAVLMIGAAFSFALMAVLIRIASAELHAFEIAFFRNFFGLVVMLPWLLTGDGFRQLATPRFGLYLSRAVLGIAAMLAFFWALTAMPIAEAVALSFTAPLFVTVGAALVLGEVVRARRWSATIIGFAGMLMILRPGVTTLEPAALAALFSAAAMAGSALCIKVLSRTESSQAIITWMALMMTPLALPAALLVWEWPDAMTWFYLALIGGVGTLGHSCLTLAMKTADVSYVMPFDFVRLLAVTFFAWLLFDEVMDAWAWAGASVIFAATLYIVHRESKLNILDEPEKAALTERAR